MSATTPSPSDILQRMKQERLRLQEAMYEGQETTLAGREDLVGQV